MPEILIFQFSNKSKCKNEAIGKLLEDEKIIQYDFCYQPNRPFILKENEGPKSEFLIKPCDTSGRYGIFMQHGIYKHLREIRKIFSKYDPTGSIKGYFAFKDIPGTDYVPLYGPIKIARADSDMDDILSPTAALGNHIITLLQCINNNASGLDLLKRIEKLSREVTIKYSSNNIWYDREHNQLLIGLLSDYKYSENYGNGNFDDAICRNWITFAHELIHFKHYVENPEEFIRRTSTYDETWSNVEDQLTITGKTDDGKTDEIYENKLREDMKIAPRESHEDNRWNCREPVSV